MTWAEKAFAELVALAPRGTKPPAGVLSQLQRLEERSRSGNWNDPPVTLTALEHHRAMIMAVVSIEMGGGRAEAEELFSVLLSSGSLNSKPDSEVQWAEVIGWLNPPTSGQGALGVHGIAAKLTTTFGSVVCGVRGYQGERKAFVALSAKLALRW